MAGDLLPQLLARVALKRQPADQQQVENNAQAEDVGPAVNPVPLAPGLLGDSCTMECRRSAACARVRFSQGQAEVHHEWYAVQIDQDVTRLDIAVYQTLLVVRGAVPRRWWPPVPPPGGKRRRSPASFDESVWPSMNLETT